MPFYQPTTVERTFRDADQSGLKCFFSRMKLKTMSLAIHSKTQTFQERGPLALMKLPLRPLPRRIHHMTEFIHTE